MTKLRVIALTSFLAHLWFSDSKLLTAVVRSSEERIDFGILPLLHILTSAQIENLLQLLHLYRFLRSQCDELRDVLTDVRNAPDVP